MISIVVINFKDPALLRLSLRSLTRLSDEYREYEIVVIDSAATTETRNVAVEEFESEGHPIRYVPFKENIGYTRGVNEGIRHASGDDILIVNPDIIPLPGAIAALRSYCAQNPWAGLVGPQLLNFDGSRQESCFRFYQPITILLRRTPLGKLPWAKKSLARFAMKDTDTSRTIPVGWLMGSALMTTKKAIEKIGLMDEHFFLYMSEVDWARRFWENGYQVVYYPEARMYHYHKRSSKGTLALFDVFFRKETRWHLKDAISYFKKYGTRPYHPHDAH